MTEPVKSAEILVRENDSLRMRLEELTDVLTAIRTGAVDALVIDGPTGEQIFTLEGAEHPYRTFVETMNEGAVTLAVDYTIVYSNRVFADLVGLPLQQTLGSNLLDFVTQEGRTALEALLNETDRASVRDEILLDRPGGKAIPVRLSARRLPQKHGDWLCLVITDLRGQKLQEALRKSQAQLAVELSDSKLLQSTSAQLIYEENIDALYQNIVDAAMTLMESDMASMQMLYPERGTGGELRLVAFRGFNPQAARFWEWVRVDSNSSCGVALRTGERVIVPDVERCDFMVGTNDLALYRQTGIQAVQTTPLVSRNGKTVGMISTHWSKPHQPTERNLRLLDILARQAADLMERRNAEDALRRWNADLEQEVSRRTAELVESRERLRALTTELSLAEQRERKRLATELHDYLAQLLALSLMKLSQVRQKNKLPLGSVDLFNKAQDLVMEALNYTRTLVTDLTPPMLHTFGLQSALRWLADQMQRHQLKVSLFLLREDELALSEEQALLLFQSVRELLINVSKHSGTNEATVSLAQYDGTLQIEVRDIGKGFEGHSQVGGGDSTHFGLFSIRERMQSLGGVFELETERGKGTRVTLALPLSDKCVADLQSNNGKSSSVDSKVNPQLSPRGTEPIPSNPTYESPGAPVIRILLVDDHAMVQQGLRSLLDNYPDLEVVGEASNGEEALASVNKLHPTMVVMDINMPIMNGIEATAAIKAGHPEITVIGLSVQTGAEMQLAMRKAGAAVLLTKEAAMDQLYQTIQTLQQAMHT